MIKVITYGTYDLIHKGHIRLLERAKALGDYLIVGVTADSFDRERGKINVQQPLIERIEAVRATGLADEIIVEEYEGQKIDDIKRLDVDIFTVGSDWEGHFDYLKEFCKVVYLERTQGISSSEIRAEKRDMRIGLIGESPILNKIERESHYVNGLSISGVYSRDTTCFSTELKKLTTYYSIDDLLEDSDGVYIISSPKHHYDDIKRALSKGKHVLCESPITIYEEQLTELYTIAESNKCILMDSLKTAYSLAYYRLCLLAKSGIIGKIVSVDATCTSLYNVEIDNDGMMSSIWNSICAWGPTALLPVFQLLGTDYSSKTIATHLLREDLDYDTFTKISLIYPHAVASIKVGQGVKSEGELIISGTKGYIYVPAPWWKTDYFEVRYENPADNKRHFYPLEGEGLRYELVSFLKSINSGNKYSYIDKNISRAIVNIIQNFYERKDTVLL
ncbi:glycosyltransferase family 2 protein [Prevotella herbatica]|uniref:Glycosyltransferase family 2 protein n=1 Tax=Prevotella herbatica TaxID=2801997 RepID=A0ABM7NXD2_9BACT|nr:adenylyltransferase/cytidyltransferase family protein [Prevotella herbatica]BCS85173.1 glycosyltransferase family 2 protein [Prevotella herbatica]